MKNTPEYMSDIELLTGIYTEIKEIKKKIPDNNRQVITDIGFIDNGELCRGMNISKKTAATWRRNGILRFTKIEGKFYYKTSDVKDMLQERFGRT